MVQLNFNLTLVCTVLRSFALTFKGNLQAACSYVILVYSQVHENNTAPLKLVVSKFSKCKSCHEHKHKP